MQDTKKEGDKMKNTMKKPVAISVEKLRPFAGHPFKVKDDEEMNAQAVEMKKRYQDGQLSADMIGEILSREKANQKETIKIPSVRLEGKIPSGYTVQQKEDFIVKAVDHYNKYRARQRDRDSR